MVRPCSSPASEGSWRGAPKTRSTPCHISIPESPRRSRDHRRRSALLPTSDVRHPPLLQSRASELNLRRVEVKPQYLVYRLREFSRANKPGEPEGIRDCILVKAALLEIFKTATAQMYSMRSGETKRFTAQSVDMPLAVTPLSDRLPRSAKRNPEPATKSFAVLDTKTSCASASGNTLDRKAADIIRPSPRIRRYEDRHGFQFQADGFRRRRRKHNVRRVRDRRRWPEYRSRYS
jgi:hypothetical protein